jgi:hypothetical protein
MCSAVGGSRALLLPCILLECQTRTSGLYTGTRCRPLSAPGRRRVGLASGLASPLKHWPGRASPAISMGRTRGCPPNMHPHTGSANCGRRDRPDDPEALPENLFRRVHCAFPARRAEIRKSTRRTVQQRTPTFLCSTKYHGPIHGASRVPVRKATSSSLSRNPRGKNYSRRSRRCTVTAPLLSRHVRPRHYAVQRFLRAFSLFLVQPASQDGETPS